MKRLILILLVCFVPACAPTPEQYTDLESRIMDATDSQSVLIQVDHGEVMVVESQDHQVEIRGQVLFPDELEYQVSSKEKQISVKVFAHRDGFSNPPLRVEVRVPKQMQVKVETDSASVFASNYQGDLEVASTSGNITVEHAAGKMTLRSNRGNITVRESLGIIGVVGNYGALNVQNVHGETSVSTIMGNVVFAGLIETGDIVRLETDHGPVFVNLGKGSALYLRIRSTSGDVACMLPDITSSTRSCDGQVGEGETGELNIRTVSGSITLQMIP